MNFSLTQDLKDIIIVMRDTGIRNVSALYRMREENIDYDAGTITISDSKTKPGTRIVPMTDRVGEILSARCAGRSEGWVWQSRYRAKHIEAAMVERKSIAARRKAGCRPIWCSTAPGMTMGAPCCRRRAI